VPEALFAGQSGLGIHLGLASATHPKQLDSSAVQGQAFSVETFRFSLRFQRGGRQINKLSCQ